LALSLAKGKIANIYTDCRYTIARANVLGLYIRKGRLLTAEGKTIKNKDEILALLEALRLPLKVAIVHCPGHQKGMDVRARGNRLQGRLHQTPKLEP
jgi:ribonuclease HI